MVKKKSFLLLWLRFPKQKEKYTFTAKLANMSLPCYVTVYCQNQNTKLQAMLSNIKHFPDLKQTPLV